MDRFRYLSVEEAARVRILIQEGRSQREIARIFGVSHSCIGKVVKRFRETGSDMRRQGQGRPRQTNEIDDRFLRLQALRKRTSNSTQLQGLIRQVRNVRISARTVRRRLNESGLASRRPKIAPLLTRRHRVARLQFARQHANWTLARWKKVLFTDETRVSLQGPDGRQRVWRRPCERYAQQCIVPRVPFGGGSRMFWGGISFEARTEVVSIPPPHLNARRYVEDVIEQHVEPFALRIGRDFVLMHDNARPHSADIVTAHLRHVGIRAIEWPAKSPDLNPIEHIWDMIKKKVRARDDVPQTLAELEAVVQEEWENIPEDVIKHFIRGMPRRIEAVLRARGGNTRY